MSADGSLLVAAEYDRYSERVHICDSRNARVVRSIESTALILAIVSSVDGKRVVWGQYDGVICVLDLDSDNVQRLEGHKGEVHTVDLSPDGRYILSASADKTMKLWDIKMAGCVRTFAGNVQSVTSAMFSADSRYVVSGSEDGTVSVWTLDWELDESASN
jgi:WD40 repeat protein